MRGLHLARSGEASAEDEQSPRVTTPRSVYGRQSPGRESGSRRRIAEGIERAEVWALARVCDTGSWGS